jgi:hypothetical protein
VVTQTASVIGAVDTALSTVNSTFSGAQQAGLCSDRGELARAERCENRFESVIANLQNSAENQSAARSRIRDADFAAETAELTRAQILQQAGISVLWRRPMPHPRACWPCCSKHRVQPQPGLERARDGAGGWTRGSGPTLFRLMH